MGGVTPLSPVDAAEQLSSAWRHRFGCPAPRRALAVLLAQWALETDRGRCMYGFNFAGIKATSGSETSAVLSTVEGAGPRARRVRARFRTYATVSAGAGDYLKLLAERFPEALAAAARGDPRAFVRGLAQRRYFSGDARAYTSAVARLSHEFSTGVPPLRVDAPLFVVEGVVRAFQVAMARRG